MESEKNFKSGFEEKPDKNENAHSAGEPKRFRLFEKPLIDFPVKGKPGELWQMDPNLSVDAQIIIFILHFVFWEWIDHRRPVHIDQIMNIPMIKKNNYDKEEIEALLQKTFLHGTVLRHREKKDFYVPFTAYYGYDAVRHHLE